MRTLSSLAFFALLALGACSSAGEHYTLCDDGSDCDSGLTCYTVAYEEGADGQMCSGTCATDFDCPGNGACYELVGDPMVGQRVCYERCFDDYDCPLHFACIPTVNDDTGETDAVCMPCDSSGCPE